MAREEIEIRDFGMFYEIVKSISRMADGVKFMLDENGLVVYAKNDYSKCNLTSNAIYSHGNVEFCIAELQMFLRVLTTVKETYKDDFSSIRMSWEQPFIRIESGKFKTKIASVDEQRVSKFVAAKIKSELSPRLEFTTSSSLLKTINGHSFIFQNSGDARIYVTTESGMQNNTIFATIGNESNPLSNSVTLELGLINSGSIVNEDGSQQKIILDFNRLNILNMFQSDEIKVSIDKRLPILVSDITRNGKNDSFLSARVCSFMLVR